MRNALNSQKGFTLVEVLVAVGLLVVVMSSLGMTMGHALASETKIIDDGLAINEMRKGFSWFASDMKRAKATDLTDGGPAAASVTATWTDQYQGAGTAHSVTYALVNGNLVRTYDGASHTVGRNVSSVAFSRAGNTVVAQVTVEVRPGFTRMLSVKTVKRATS